MGLFSSWIAGLRQRITPGAPPRNAAEAGMLGLHYYNEELEEIADSVSVWRLRGERDDAFRHRAALALQAKILQLEADLDRVINVDKR